jgi:hypothetical protein
MGLKNLIIYVDLACVERSNVLYFNNRDVRIGKTIKLSTEDVYFEPIVTGIGEETTFLIIPEREPIEKGNETFEQENNTVSVELVRARLLLDRVPSYVFDVLGEGDSLLGGIRNISKINSINNIIENPDGTINAEIIIQLEAINQSNSLYFNNQELKIGKTINLKTTKNYFKAEIVEYGKTVTASEPSKKQIKIKLSSVDKWMADLITVGLEKKAGEQILAKVIEKDVKHSALVSVTDSGNVLLRENPLKYDLELTVDILLYEKGPAVTYQGQVIDVGKRIELDFEEITISGVIKSIN